MNFLRFVENFLIALLRTRFNQSFTAQQYESLLGLLEHTCGGPIGFRVAETPVFLPLALLEQMATSGAELAQALIESPTYLAAARQAIPAGYCVANETPHPHFLTADFALVRGPRGALLPRLVEIQAFPSVYGYQEVLNQAYREAYSLPESLGVFLGGLDEARYWELLGRTILAGHAPENVVLTELDPENQKTLPDFTVSAARLGIQVVDIRSLQAIEKKLYYRNPAGRLVHIERIYNRAIADELMARQVSLPFDLTHPWEVEWAGHPNWYFLISKFSIPWLCRPGALTPPGGESPGPFPVVPPAVLLSDFLDGTGRAELAAVGVPLSADVGPETVYDDLLLKPLFSFAGRGIHFDPTERLLQEIPPADRFSFLLQQRMRFEPTIETPHGLTQAEFRILYLWPDGDPLTPALSLVRLGRGKMMGVDHNKNQEWVGASAAFWVQDPARGI
jgi:hypothetical protein